MIFQLLKYAIHAIQHVFTSHIVMMFILLEPNGIVVLAQTSQIGHGLGVYALVVYWSSRSIGSFLVQLVLVSDKEQTCSLSKAQIVLSLKSNRNPLIYNRLQNGRAPDQVIETLVYLCMTMTVSSI